MSTYIKPMEDKDGNAVLPITSTMAVYDSEGVPIGDSLKQTSIEVDDEVLNTINDKLNYLIQNGIPDIEKLFDSYEIKSSGGGTNGVGCSYICDTDGYYLCVGGTSASGGTSKISGYDKVIIGDQRSSAICYLVHAKAGSKLELSYINQVAGQSANFLIMKLILN